MTDYYNDQIACLIERNRNMNQERRYHYTNALLLPTDNELLAKIASQQNKYNDPRPPEPVEGTGVESTIQRGDPPRQGLRSDNPPPNRELYKRKGKEVVKVRDPTSNRYDRADDPQKKQPERMRFDEFIKKFKYNLPDKKKKVRDQSTRLRGKGG